MTQTIYRSHIADPELPKSSLFQYLFPGQNGTSPLEPLDPALPAYIDGLSGETLSRKDVEHNALCLLSGLAALGVARRDVACIWGVNSLHWINAVWGCQALGVTCSPANVAYSPSELAHQFNDSGSSVLFLDPALVPVFDQARNLFKRPLPDSRVILLCRPENKPARSAYKAIYEIFGPRGEAERFAADQVNDTAFLCYSSGTTGLPKGVMTTHHNMTSQVQAINLSLETLEQGKDTILGVLPLSHIYGLAIVLIQPLATGVPVVIFPRFDEIPVLEAIQKYKITFGLIVPPIIIVLVNSPNVAKYDLSSLRVLMSGAAPLSSELINKFRTRFPTIHLTQGYGMTETSPVVTVMRSENSDTHKGSCGVLIPTFEARLVKEDGQDADPATGEPGELWVRSPSVMKGYHANAEANAKSFAPGGWFMTGDVAVRSKDGWYTIVDRAKELIKYKGFQVPPAELEALIHTHPKIADVAVIGLWDESQATELPRAYIVPAAGVPAKTDAEVAAFAKEVQAWVAARVAQHKKLRGGVEVIAAVPKSPSGKILRKDLRHKATDDLKHGRIRLAQARL